jgi:glutamine amidotransferase
MCRWFLFYSHNKIIMKDLLCKPNNSLIKQSYKKPYSPLLNVPNNRDHEINVDGFGIGWYFDNNIEPCKYLGLKPPWNDINLINISKFIKTHLLFGHIRAIKPFSNSIVHEYNCHPFSYKNFLFMHNGDISNFSSFKKSVVTYLNDDVYSKIRGNTDSEFCFAIFLNMLKKKFYNNGGYLPPQYFKHLVLRVIKKIYHFSIKNDINSSLSLNFAFTDGRTIICTRFLNKKNEEPPSLYYYKKNNNVIISSEPIEYEDPDWNLLDKNNLIIIKKNLKISIEPVLI